jgi:RNA recognition motif-containing protein
MDVSEDELRKFFEPYTVMSVSLRRGGYKGMAFAHVRFDSPETCRKAADEYAGKRVRKNRIRLDWAVEKSGGETHAQPASVTPKVTEELRGTTPRVYVGGLNDMMIEEDLKVAFSPFGTIVAVKLHKDKVGVRSFGYVTFESAQGAERAVDSAGQVSVKGQRVRIDFARQDRTAGMNGQTHAVLPVRISRSPSPQQPRITPVSYEVPSGYSQMKSWDECYGSLLARSNGM